MRVSVCPGMCSVKQNKDSRSKNTHGKTDLSSRLLQKRKNNKKAQCNHIKAVLLAEVYDCGVCVEGGWGGVIRKTSQCN